MNPNGYTDCARHGCLCSDRKVKMPWCIPSVDEIRSGDATRSYRLAEKLATEVKASNPHAQDWSKI
jgi:hypothetical protein